jgi:hypothetical protein
MLHDYQALTRRAENTILDYVARAKLATSAEEYNQALNAAAGVFDLWMAAVQLPEDVELHSAFVHLDALRLQSLCEPENVPHGTWAKK